MFALEKKSFMREQLQFVFNYFIVINIILLQYLYQLESGIRLIPGHPVVPLWLYSLHFFTLAFARSTNR